MTRCELCSNQRTHTLGSLPPLNCMTGNLYFRGSGEALWETSDATQSTNYNAKNSAGDGFCSLTAEANGGQDQ